MSEQDMKRERGWYINDVNMYPTSELETHIIYHSDLPKIDPALIQELLNSKCTDHSISIQTRP